MSSKEGLATFGPTESLPVQEQVSVPNEILGATEALSDKLKHISDPRIRFEAVSHALRVLAGVRSGVIAEIVQVDPERYGSGM